MITLSPTGARILDSNNDGVVSGHAAAMARLEADGLVVRHDRDGGTHWMTEDGWTALDTWRQKNGRAPAAPVTIPRRLPKAQHDAILTAAGRPDQLVPGRDDGDVFAAGETWFRGPTLRAVHAAGYADFWRRPGEENAPYTGRSLYLTPAGREYARLRGSIDVHRRRVVIIACGSEKLPHPGRNEYGNLNAGYPAGELYTGQYHRSLRLAADALTAPSLIRIASALHGLVDLKRPLLPYDVTIGDERAVTAERVARHAAELGTDDADVIFLGGQEYAALLRPAIPHLLTPLAGGMGEHRGLCKQAREDAAVRDAWWKEAAELHAEHHPARA
ncbi:DUF6884 domain-containing protein [Streptomyces tirandamycinicus]|uniref:DUF6884 domain-containing protein n=1 Tax=Streptomyces tirandamycinicus TaxID=2174846 RepID=A0A2S1T1V5_9ACTN|nr:DUF6884 domain-containing protein [Streptomyces tirandamycinicus]AWI32655.1 hypothetical protein DDW44_30520 [Streptomyces tirandamycinicus]